MKRTFVIPDIHGCCRTFRQLLFNKLEIEKTDTLFLLGDYIDRGPDSKGVIETIFELQRDGYDVQAIRGNHEQMLIEFLASNSDEDLMDWLENGGDATVQSYDLENGGCITSEHIHFVKVLPVCIVTDSYIFVHAGLDFSLDDPIMETSLEFKLWTRKNLLVKSEKIGGRKVIVGHTPRSLQTIEKSLTSNLIQLDNGCFIRDLHRERGNLVALDLGHNMLYVQKNIDGFEL